MEVSCKTRPGGDGPEANAPTLKLVFRIRCIFADQLVSMAYLSAPKNPLFIAVVRVVTALGRLSSIVAIVAVRAVTALGWLSSIVATHDIRSWDFD